MSLEYLLTHFEDYHPREIDRWREYYNQDHRVEALGISLPARARVLEIQGGYAKMSVAVVAEMVRPHGWRTRSVDSEELHQLWRRTRIASRFPRALQDMLVDGIVYWAVDGFEDSDTPRVIPIDAKRATVRLNQYGEPVEGVVRYTLPDEGEQVTYYTPEGYEVYRRESADARLKFCGSVPTPGMALVPMVNRSVTSDAYGRSDIADIASLVDGAARTLTNMQILQEVAAAPLRIITGEGAAESIDQFGDALEMMGRIYAGPSGTKIETATGASLDPYISAYKLYGLQISAVTGIPPSMMGVSSDNNPTSAEALRTAKDRLIARAEDKQLSCTEALEAIGRLLLPDADDLEVAWRDAAAPSESAQVANILQSAAQGIVSAETAREFLNLTSEQLEREAANERGDVGESVAVDDFLTAVPEDEAAA